MSAHLNLHIHLEREASMIDISVNEAPPNGNYVVIGYGANVGTTVPGHHANADNSVSIFINGTNSDIVEEIDSFIAELNKARNELLRREVQYQAENGDRWT